MVEENHTPLTSKIRFCFMVRHGERAYCVGDDEFMAVENYDDPPITKNGIE